MWYTYPIHEGKWLCQRIGAPSEVTVRWNEDRSTWVAEELNAEGEVVWIIFEGEFTGCRWKKADSKE